ncbi:MAG: hypothetical protein OXP12_06425 [Thaumarchaeota archaeon]|nr:hypothetical protein [Nitrososphaerota archaeon]
MNPKSNGVARGFGAYAKMLRFRRDHPRTFYEKPARRSSVEGAFSAIKARFGCFVRALKKRNRAVGPMSMAICYDISCSKSNWWL